MSDVLPFVVSVKRLKEFERAITGRKTRINAQTKEEEEVILPPLELPHHCATCGVQFEGPIERRWCSISCAKKWKRK